MSTAGEKKVSREGLAALVGASVERRLGKEAVADQSADLFELGLDSIDAIEVTGEIEQALGIEVDPALLFECRTIEATAESILGLLAKG